MRRRVGVFLASAALCAAVFPSAASAAILPTPDVETREAIDMFRAEVRSRVAAPYRDWLYDYDGRPAGVSADQWNEAMVQKTKAEAATLASLKVLDPVSRRFLKTYWAAVTKALRSPAPAGLGPARR